MSSSALQIGPAAEEVSAGLFGKGDVHIIQGFFDPCQMKRLSAVLEGGAYTADDYEGVVDTGARLHEQGKLPPPPISMRQAQRPQLRSVPSSGNHPAQRPSA